MSRRYGQYCFLASALDVVGERWTLLIVRELLAGPKRYVDLLQGLPGIGTNLLAARLKQLAAEGVVQQRKLPPPAGSAVYELTDLGRKLRPALIELARWGRELGSPAEAQVFRAEWAVLFLRSLVRGATAPTDIDAAYEFHVDGEIFHIRVGNGQIEVEQGPASGPASVLLTDAETLFAVGSGELMPPRAVAQGRIRLQGAPNELGALLQVLDSLDL